MTVLYGGAFDPPHLGHVAVARAARARFGVEQLVVLVGVRPAHRTVHADAEDRLALAHAAFPGDDVRLDPYPRTVELLRAEAFEKPVFVVGADQFSGFLGWAEPDEVLERTRLAVATRPGFPRVELDAVLEQLARPERVLFFEIEPNPAASTERARPRRRGRAARRFRPRCRRASDRGAPALPSVTGGYTGRDRTRGAEQTLTSLEQARRIAALAQEKLAEEVVILDMRPECSFTDYFVIATGATRARPRRSGTR